MKYESAILVFLSSALTALFAWIRYGKTDKAKVNQINIDSESEKEVKLSKAALEWTIILQAQVEKANLMIDKKQTENERLHDIIDTMKIDFDKNIKEITFNFNNRMRELEKEFEESHIEFINERKANLQEIERLKKQIELGSA